MDTQLDALPILPVLARGVSGCVNSAFSETIATILGGWDLAHAIRLGIKPFAELGANSEALSGSQVDSPGSCRAIFESAPVAMLQSRKISQIPARVTPAKGSTTPNIG